MGPAGAGLTLPRVGAESSFLVVEQFAAQLPESASEIVKCWAGDTVLGEVVGVELGGLSEGIGQDARVEATVGALRESKKGVAGVAAGSEGGVDVDEVAGERSPVEGAHLVRDRVVRVEDRSDGHQDWFVGAPVHAEFDLGDPHAVGDGQPGEGTGARFRR